MKTNLDKFFKTNELAEKDGVDFVIDEKTAFRVRRFSPANPQVRAAMATHFKPYARQIQMGTMDPKKEQEIMVKVFANACLVGWRGVEIDGKEVEFSVENAIKVLTNLPDLFQTLFDHAQNPEHYREEVGN